jgi:Tfp pilus assembly protein PilF
MCTFRQKLAIVSCLGLFMATAAMAEQTSREWQSCNNADNDTRIAACTGILDKGGRESNKVRANAYANRGIAFGNKGQHDRAIQDFDEALRLDPQNAVMYNNAAGPSRTRATSTAASGTSTRRSGSIRNWRSDSIAAEAPTTSRAITTRNPGPGRGTPPQSKICECVDQPRPLL